MPVEELGNCQEPDLTVLPGLKEVFRYDELHNSFSYFQDSNHLNDYCKKKLNVVEPRVVHNLKF